MLLRVCSHVLPVISYREPREVALALQAIYPLKTGFATFCGFATACVRVWDAGYDACRCWL